MSWQSVELTGKSHIIPRVCPNCMAEGTVAYRTPYKRGRTTYSQTFYYCPQCAEAVSWSAWKRWAWWPGVFILLVICITAIGAGGSALIDSIGAAPGSTEALSIFIPLVAFGVIVVLGVPLALTRMANSKPLPPGALGRTPAAFYCGPKSALKTFFTLDHDDYIYSAARPEWLQLFIRANEATMPAAAYQQATGQQKQTPF